MKPNTLPKNANQRPAFNAAQMTGLLCISAILSAKTAAAIDFVVSTPASVTYVENNAAAHSSLTNSVKTIVSGSTRAAPDAKTIDLSQFALDESRSSVLDAANSHKHVQPTVKVSYQLPTRRIER